MKVLIRRLLADYILRFKELTNKLLCAIYKIPKAGSFVNDQVVKQGNKALKLALGIVAQIGLLAWEIIKRILFAEVFVYLPYVIIAGNCPLVRDKKGAALIYMFIVICTVCGTLVNNRVMSRDARSYMMAKVMLINPAVGLFSNVVYRMIMDFAGFSLALGIMGVSFENSIIIGFSTAFIRPLGEVFAIVVYEKFKSIYTNRNIYNGCIMAAAIIFAYGMPVVTRTVSDMWMALAHPALVVVSLIIGVLSLLVLFNYRHYYSLLVDTVQD